jgi:hypothetical protein
MSWHSLEFASRFWENKPLSNDEIISVRVSEPIQSVRVTEDSPGSTRIFESAPTIIPTGDTADIVELNPPISGIGTVQEMLEELNTRDIGRSLFFSDIDLTSMDILVITHGLGKVPSNHEVFFPRGPDLDPVFPNLVSKSSTLISLDFSGFRPVPNNSILFVRS